MDGVGIKKAWALGMDNGYEGGEPPLFLFHSKKDAEAVKKVIEDTSYRSVYLVEVPYWPHVAEEN